MFLLARDIELLNRFNMDELRKLQLIELDVLKYVDSFCRRNDIHYSLYGGTLLGAIRHKGFIPWDDDLDICMLRSEYERFLALWAKEKHEGYIIQNKETDHDFSQSFTKVRKNNTAFVQEYDVGKDYHKGIFIDIFPFDRIPTGFQRKVYKIVAMFYLLCCREFVPPRSKSTCFQRLVTKFFFMCTSEKTRTKIRKFLFNWMRNFDTDTSLELVSVATLLALSIIYPANIANRLVEVDFEGLKFFAWENWNSALSLLYGDYWVLPPEDERNWPHRPLLLDFENNA